GGARAVPLPRSSLDQLPVGGVVGVAQHVAGALPALRRARRVPPGSAGQLHLPLEEIEIELRVPEPLLLHERQELAEPLGDLTALQEEVLARLVEVVSRGD